MSKDKDYIKGIDAAERRYFTTTVKMETRADGENTSKVIEGMAALYNSVTRIGNWFDEEILPGAFDDVMNDDVRCLFNHNPNYILARSVNGKGTLNLELTDEGLKYSYTTPKRSYAEDLEDAIESGDVSGSSFAFRIKEQKWIQRKDDVELRQIVKFERLLDVAPVTYPAYPDASVGKRSLENFKEENKKVNPKTKNVREAQYIINKN
ncbi:HK97 family phage prohead protease, partial [Polaribacter sp.]|uniref:HK97 family phage prohead protease n=1 Tax=Polaribacter sp. TaxID=1920175 RepID=UPI003F6D4DA9